jgi:hypothetical protein
MAIHSPGENCQQTGKRRLANKYEKNSYAIHHNNLLGNSGVLGISAAEMSQ